MYTAIKKASRRRTRQYDTGQIRTCLYDMVEAVRETVPGSRDRIVARIVARMLEEGRARFVGHSWT